MGFIEEKIKISAPCDKVYNFWIDKYLQMGVDIGKEGHVVAGNKKGIKFKIQELKKNESITIVWFAHFIKLIYFHNVEPLEKGSLITCRVSIKGFFSFLIRPLISNKIRKYLQLSLKQFSLDLDNR
ncbi:MAG: hypothetical protein WCT85_03995 [Parachlamydiales bacterium]|jgi:hypothetical protein